MRSPGFFGLQFCGRSPSLRLVSFPLSFAMDSDDDTRVDDSEVSGFFSDLDLEELGFGRDLTANLHEKNVGDVGKNAADDNVDGDDLVDFDMHGVPKHGYSRSRRLLYLR